MNKAATNDFMIIFSYKYMITIEFLMFLITNFM